MAIIVINHANNSAPVLSRDCSTYVRGGSKVIDNCDGYFCMSKVADKEKSVFRGEFTDYVFIPNLFYLRFVNKRETGSTINKILEIDKNLNVVALDANPSDYEMS